MRARVATVSTWLRRILIGAVVIAVVLALYLIVLTRGGILG